MTDINYGGNDPCGTTHKPIEHDDITELVRANARTTLIGYRNELSDRDIDFICDQIARKSQLDYQLLEPVETDGK